MSTPANQPETQQLPVFYSQNSEAYKGSKIVLRANPEATAQGKSPAHYTGSIGKTQVFLWEAPASNRGPFFNVKMSDGARGLVQVGVANAYVNTRGNNSLSISLRFNSRQDAENFKATHEINEPIKEVTRDNGSVFYVNLYADVSKRHVQDNPQEFQRLGFNTQFNPAK